MGTNATWQKGLDLAVKLGGEEFHETVKFLKEIDEGVAEVLVEQVFGENLAAELLPLEDQELCTIASLVVQDHQQQLMWHLKGSHRVGISPDTLLGVIVHCIPFSGMPKGIRALRTFHTWVTESEIDFTPKTSEQVYGSSEPDLTALGKEMGGKIYADYEGLENAVSSIDPILKDKVTRGIFGRFYGRNDLNMRQRQLTAVTILTSLQRLPQLESHIKGALMVGCTADEIRAAIIIMHIYAGWPATLNALQVLVKVTTS